MFIVFFSIVNIIDIWVVGVYIMVMVVKWIVSYRVIS